MFPNFLYHYLGLTNNFFLIPTVIELSTCNVRGKEGPLPADCSEAYNNTEAGNVIQVIDDQLYKGVQVWKVPSENYYT